MADNRYQLMTEIINLSVAENWEDAKLEWQLDSIEKIEEDDPSTCLCGHYPIIELCYIKNIVNGEETIVGNVCVTNFLGIDSESMFASLRKIYSDREKSISTALAVYAKDKGLINDWEYKFCLDTKRKRNLSARQMEKRLQINDKLLRSIRRKGI